MNRDDLKKEKEKRVFREFLKHLDDVELSFESFNCGESPDFVHKYKPLGVELTEYHRDLVFSSSRGSGLKRREECYREFVERAKTKFLERNPTERIDVFIFPKNYRGSESSFSLKEFQEASNLLTEFVELHLDQELEKDFSSSNHLLSHYISRLESYPTPKYQKDVSWMIAEAAILDVLPEAVSFLIEKKNGNKELSRYRAKDNKIWLLIHSTARSCIGTSSLGRNSTCGVITSELKHCMFNTKFDRVFYLDEDSQELLELQIQHDTQ